MPKLDNIDYNILRNIQADGRISNLNLADKIGLSPSPCLRRVRDLEKRKVIKRYVGLIDPKAVGFLINAFVNVRLRSQEKKFLNIFEHKVAFYTGFLRFLNKKLHFTQVFQHSYTEIRVLHMFFQVFSKLNVRPLVGE